MSLAALLTLIGLTAPAAWASEPENPFWKVSGKRLEAENRETASIADVVGTESIIHGTLGSTKVEIRCKQGGLGEADLEGSAAKHAGKALGALELSECKLFANEGTEYKEKTACEVPAIKSGKLSGGLWLEGTKAAAGTKAALVFEPKELTEGKSVVASLVINGSSCSLKGTYKLEGGMATTLLPENEEFSYIQWVFPVTPVATVWRPPSQEGEMTIGLALDGNTASYSGEMKAALKSVHRFGGGTAPVEGIEAPYWTVGGERLEEGETRELKSETTGKPPAIHQTIKGTETKVECTRGVLKKGYILGSKGQSDGKIYYPVEFIECKIFAMEGGKFVEQPKCEVPPIKMNPLAGRLWLEGQESERGTKPLLVLEPETLTEGKPVVAEEAVRNKGGETCGYAEEKYKIEGSLPLTLSPANKEATSIKFILPERPPEDVWQPAEQHRTKRVGLTHEEKQVVIEGETNNEGKEKFGGGVEGGYEGRRWHVNGMELHGAETFSETGAVSVGSRLTFEKKEIEVACTTLKPRAGFIKETTALGAETFAFEGCSANKPTHCTVSGGVIKTQPVRTTLSGVVNVEITFTPLSGTTIASFKLASSGGTCPFNGKEFKLAGKAVGDLVNPESEHALEEITFHTGAGELTVNAEEATLETTIGLGLVSGLYWGLN
jgi:hypothetical protein